jgi:hypothetical protein
LVKCDDDPYNRGRRMHGGRKRTGNSYRYHHLTPSRVPFPAHRWPRGRHFPGSRRSRSARSSNR